jgi:hypothetical protein
MEKDVSLFQSFFSCSRIPAHSMIRYMRRDVTKNVSSLLSCLLSPSLIDGFPTELETLIHDAMTFWWLAQRSPFKIEASVEDMEGWGWNDLNIFDNPVESLTSDRF